MDNHFCLPDYKYTYHWEDITQWKYLKNEYTFSNELRKLLDKRTRFFISS